MERHYQQEVRNQDMTIDELKKRLRNATALNKIDAPFRSQSANPRNVPKYHAQVKDYNPYAYIGYDNPEHLMLVTLDHIKQKIVNLNAHDIVPTFSTPVFQWATKIRRSLLQHGQKKLHL